MNNNDNGYHKAQRDYDNQLPDDWQEDLEREERRMRKEESFADTWEDEEDESYEK